MGLVFDSYIVLEYDDLDDLLLYVKKDVEAIKKVCNRNIKRLLPRTEKNERNMMRVTCQMGTLIDDWINSGGPNRRNC